MLGRCRYRCRGGAAANGDGVDEPVLTGAEDGDGPRIEDGGDGS